MGRNAVTVRQEVFRAQAFLESKAGRNALGSGETTSGSAQLPTSDREPHSLIRLLKRLLEDVVKGAVTTRSYNKASELKRYFDELPAELHPVKRVPNSPPTAFRDLNIAPPKKPAPLVQPTAAQQQSRPARLRDTLAPRQMEFKQPLNAKGRQFLREAASISLKSNPLSAAFILRGFIQFVVDTYMHDNAIPFWEGEKQLELHVRADRVIDHLITSKIAKRADLSGIKRRLSERATKNPSSIRALNDYHHDHTSSRARRPARRLGRSHGSVRSHLGAGWCMSDDKRRAVPLSGHFSPLRYPGGKGKLAKFIATLVKLNGHDGLYVEPYAGGAAIGLELLLTGLVRRVHINDLSRPIYAFWDSVLKRTDEFVRLVSDSPLDLTTWDQMKLVFANPDDHDNLALGFAMFYLNRTNRSGILNAGPIGGRAQGGIWNMDARYNRTELVSRIERIAQVRRRITLTNLDATALLDSHAASRPQLSWSTWIRPISPRDRNSTTTPTSPATMSSLPPRSAKSVISPG